MHVIVSVAATTTRGKQVPACVRNILQTRYNFGNVSSACAKEYLIAAMYYVKFKFKFVIK